jgi:hypothetical protein
MSWPEGCSWTKGYVVTKEDGFEMRVHSGPFYFRRDFLPRLFHRFGKKCFFYLGFRPTAPGSPGTGDEGWAAPLARWLKRVGWGNLGAGLKLRRLKG